jgi:hypothetical protein
MLSSLCFCFSLRFLPGSWPMPCDRLQIMRRPTVVIAGVMVTVDDDRGVCFFFLVWWDEEDEWFFLKRRRFSTKMAILNPLKFWHLVIWPLFMENIFFFLTLTLDQLQLNSWISASFTKQSLVSNLIKSIINWFFNF